MLAGLAGIGLLMPLLTRIGSFESAVVLNAAFTIAVAVMVTPSLAYMADAVSSAGVRSFGAAYGIYNFAWALGLLVGPAVGGAAYERFGFTRLVLWWAAALLPITLGLARPDARRPGLARCRIQVRRIVMNRSRIAVTLAACSLGVVPVAARRRPVEEKTKFQLAGVLGKMVNFFGGKAAREG